MRCLFPFWIPQIICKACNASTLMEPSVSSLAARYLEEIHHSGAAGKADSHLRRLCHWRKHPSCHWLDGPWAFSANNMPVVAKPARDRFTDRAIIICGDNDEAGRKRGEEAAGLANTQLLFPHFTDDNGTDFNDLHQIEGIEAVRSQLETALTKQQGLIALDMGEFLSMSIPERGYLLSPVLPVQDIGILYAPRGIGKTFAALSIAVAVASGEPCSTGVRRCPSERCMWMGKCPPLPCRTAFPLLSTACPFPRIR